MNTSVAGRQSHYLKAHPEPFQRLWDRVKRHEIRKTDRDFQLGDELVLQEYDESSSAIEGHRYTGRQIRADVTYVSMPGTWGLPDGVCVMSIEETERGGDDD